MFRVLLRNELHRRCARNGRYSLRAFARALGTDHSTLSQMMRGRRRVTDATIRALGARLRLDAIEVALHCGMGALEREILAMAGQPDFNPGSRWFAERLGRNVDEINIALQRLTRSGALRMEAARWVTQS